MKKLFSLLAVLLVFTALAFPKDKDQTLVTSSDQTSTAVFVGPVVGGSTADASGLALSLKGKGVSDTSTVSSTTVVGGVFDTGYASVGGLTESSAENIASGKGAFTFADAAVSGKISQHSGAFSADFSLDGGFGVAYAGGGNSSKATYDAGSISNHDALALGSASVEGLTNVATYTGPLDDGSFGSIAQGITASGASANATGNLYKTTTATVSGGLGLGTVAGADGAFGYTNAGASYNASDPRTSYAGVQGSIIGSGATVITPLENGVSVSTYSTITSVAMPLPKQPN